MGASEFAHITPGLPGASAAFEAAIRAGGARLRRCARRRRIARRCALACAALAVALGGFAALRCAPGPDRVATPRMAATARTEEPPRASARPPLDARPYGYVRVVGDLASGGYAGFFESPSTASRSARIPGETLVQYLEDAEDGFVKVQFAYCQGYMARSALDLADAPAPMYVRSRVTAIPVYAEMAADQASIGEIPAGARVRCLSVPWDSIQYPDGGNPFGWAEVEWVEGALRGYVSAGDLAYLPAGEAGALKAAELHVPDGRGGDFVQRLEQAGALEGLRRVVDGAAPGVTCQGGTGALLKLTLGNGETLCFTLALDGCGAMIGGNLAVYDVGEDGGAALWKLFGDCRRVLDEQD